MPPPISENAVADNDELDLFKIWDPLWQQKFFIAIFASIIMAIGAIFAFTSTPIYRITAEIAEPLPEQLTGANLEDYFSLEASRAYEMFLQALRQQTVLSKTIEEWPSADTVLTNQQKLEILEDGLRIQLPTEQRKTAARKKEPKINTLSIQMADRETGRAVLDRLIKNADEYAAETFLDATLTTLLWKEEQLELELQTQLSNAKLARQDEIKRLRSADVLKKKEIEESIELLRLRARTERLDQIARLEEQQRIQLAKLDEKLRLTRDFAKIKVDDEILRLREALAIADKLGITHPMDPEDLGNISSPGNEIKIRTRPPEDYWKGTVALSAEINRLQSREHLDAFNETIRYLEQEISEAQTNEELTELRGRQSDDPYISELPELQKALIGLERNMTIEELETRVDDTPFVSAIRDTKNALEKLAAVKKKLRSNLSFIHTVQPPSSSPNPIKPKKQLIIALSLIIGGIIGIFAALIRSANQKRNA